MLSVYVKICVVLLVKICYTEKNGGIINLGFHKLQSRFMTGGILTTRSGTSMHFLTIDSYVHVYTVSHMKFNKQRIKAGQLAKVKIFKVPFQFSLYLINRQYCYGSVDIVF